METSGEIQDQGNRRDQLVTATAQAKQKQTYSFERYGRRAFGNNLTNSQVSSRQGYENLDGVQDILRGLSKKTREVLKNAPTPNARDDEGDVVMEDAVLTPFVRSRDDGHDIPKDRLYDVFQTPRDEDGPPSEGKRLALEMHAMAQRLGTPGGRGSAKSRERTLSSASTEELKRPVARRMSILGDVQAPILDLNGFDAQGERRRHSLATPLIRHGRVDKSDETRDRINDRVVSTSHELPDAEQCRVLETKVAELEAQREEAGVILAGYQGSIAKIQDDYSKDVVTWTTENTLLKTEVERLRKERQQIHDQFSVLYHSKYLPLKEQVESLQEVSTKQQSAEAEVRALREEIGILKKQADTYKISEMALKKAVEAAESQVSTTQEEVRVAGIRLDDARQQSQAACREYQSKIDTLESALRHKDEKISMMEHKMVSMREQLDEALHQKEVATAGFQKSTLELNAREEELFSVRADLQDKMKLLEEYKRTNEGFYEIKLGYKKKIQYLNSKLAEARMP